MSTIPTSIAVPDADHVVLTFDSPPAAGAIRVVVISAAAPAISPVDPSTTGAGGLVFGETSLVELFRADGSIPPSGPRWNDDASFGGTRTWDHHTTDNSVPFSGVPGPQQTVGPYGLKWVVTAGGDGNNALILQTTTPYDTTDDRVLLLCVKKPSNDEGLRLTLQNAAGATLGDPIELTTITGIVTSVSGGKVVHDTTKAFTPASLVGLTVAITSGTGSGQSQPIFANTATSITPRFAWSTTPDATSHYRIYSFYADTNQMQPVKLTVRGAAIDGTLGNLNLPAAALVAGITIESIGASAQTIYLDELQFRPLRTRSVPLITGTRPEIRSRNTAYNYAPRIATRYVSGGDLYHLNYASRIDGNCAGTTEEILEWGATKWFGDLFAAWTAAGGPGSLADLAKAISPLETGWDQETWQGWETWGDDSGTSTTIYTLNTTGIGQAKVKYWPYYPHVRLSTAWAVEAHMSVVRYHYDSGTATSDSSIDMTGLGLVDRIRRAVGAWATGSTLCDGVHGSEDSWYARRALGGLCQDTTSGDNGLTFVGNIVSTPWTTMGDGDEFPYE